jgi:hypothetical protein
VHHILLSDDECVHDHPWAFVTFLLSGGYGERSLIKSSLLRYRWHPRWSLLYRPASYTHALIIGKPVWTLVITFKKIQEWGFYTPKGFVAWYKYHSNGGRCE